MIDNIKLELDVNSKKAVIAWLEKLRKGSGDARPLWLSVIPKVKEFINYELDSFKDSHKKWPKLNAKYKLRKINEGYFPGIGVRSGLMRKGATVFAKKTITVKELVWELNNSVVRSKDGYPYTYVFNYGTKDGTQPARPLFKYTLIRLNSFLKLDAKNFNDGTTHANFTYSWLRKSLERYTK